MRDGSRRVAGARAPISVEVVAVLLGSVALSGCGGADGSPADPPPSASVMDLGPAVAPPPSPGTGEVARFWFTRPGDNKVSVGPYAVAGDELVVRGACRSHTGRLVWKVFDNTGEAGSAAEVKILDQGEFVCDGTDQIHAATVGALRDVGILGVTGTAASSEAGESAWLTLANE